MTGYAAMAARGREEARARTAGRRKVIAERITYGEPDHGSVTALPGTTLPAYRTRPAYLIGSCGHTLAWLAAVPVDRAAPSYLTSRIGRRMTCQHEDCKIAPKPEREPREDDCTWMVGTEDNERQCRSRAKWDTTEGTVCTRHRDYLVTHGYLTEPGTPL